MLLVAGSSFAFIESNSKAESETITMTATWVTKASSVLLDQTVIMCLKPIHTALAAEVMAVAENSSAVL